MREDFPELLNLLYRAVDNPDENARIEAARTLYRQLAGAFPEEAVQRIESLKKLNQQLQDEVNRSSKWKAEYETAERLRIAAQDRLNDLQLAEKNLVRRRRLASKLQARLCQLGKVVDRIVELEDA